MEPETLVEYRYRAVCEVLGGSPIREVAARYGTSQHLVFSPGIKWLFLWLACTHAGRLCRMAAQTVAVALVVDASTTQTSGAADPAPYSKMMAEDRAVKSVAYEVFRFGAHELTDGDLLQPSSETCLLSTSSPSGRVSAELRRSSAITLQLGPSPRLELIAVVSQPGSSRRAAWSGQH